jgi:hypothetical protein
MKIRLHVHRFQLYGPVVVRNGKGELAFFGVNLPPNKVGLGILREL